MEFRSWIRNRYGWSLGIARANVAESIRRWDGKADVFGRKRGHHDWDSQKEHPNRPVMGVSWYEASACAARAGGRLLTSAEWEWAARGKQGREYPWGNEELDATRANYAETVSVP